MRRAVAVLIGAAACGLFPAAASATVTTTQVTTPADPTFQDLDLGTITGLNVTVPVTVSGTAPGAVAGDKVDIVCVGAIGVPGAEFVAKVADDVEVDAGGTFSTATGNVSAAANGPCRILALPDGTPQSPPINTAGRTGPAYYLGATFKVGIPAGPNAGQTPAYVVGGVTAETLLATAGPATLSVSAVDPSTLATDRVLSLAAAGNPVVPATQPKVDGRAFMLPFQALTHPTAPGLIAPTGIETSVHSSPTGNDFSMHASATEAALTCQPDDTTCTSFSDAGIRVTSSTDASDAGHTLASRQKWTNTTGQTKQLSLVYSLQSVESNPGWNFPGEGPGYHVHTVGDVIPPPASGTGSVGIASSAASTCATVADSCGALSWSTPPTSIAFVGPTVPLLTYERTLGPGCSVELGFAGSVGYNQAVLNGYATDARNALAAVPTAVSCPPPPPGPPAPSPVVPPSKCKKTKKKKGKKKAALAKKKKKKKCKKHKKKGKGGK